MQPLVNDLPPGVLGAFCAVEQVFSVQSLGKGNINDTYLVDEGQRKFVLQRINSTVFPQPSEVAANFDIISRHLARASQSHAIDFICSQPIRTRTGDVVHTDERGGWWRAQSYVEHAPCEQFRFNRNYAFQLGRVLATFHLLTADLDITRLREPLPEFHITPGYLRQFDHAASLWQGAASADLNWCFHFVDTYRDIADTLEVAKQKGVIQLRTVHGDPKLDNIIFDPHGQAVGMFDLDTTGPGLLHYDLGDCLRSCCNRAGETPENWQQTGFDVDICEAALRGYLQMAGHTLSPRDKFYIYDSILIITFELGLRFLTDHLCGDIYFKVTWPGENLCRALAQFHLAESIAAQEMKIRTLVAALANVHLTVS